MTSEPRNMDPLPGFTALFDHMRANGIEPPPEADIIPDRTIRFPTSGKRGDNAGWLIVFEDGMGAQYGDWRTGEKHLWQARHRRDLSAAERSAYRQNLHKAKMERKAARREAYAAAAKRAQTIWSAARPVTDDQPYLKRKRVVVPEGVNLRQIGSYELAIELGFTPESNGEQLQGELLAVPFGDLDGCIATLEFIDETGRKWSLVGGERAGKMWLPEPLPISGVGCILIGEGCATVLTVKEHSGTFAVGTGGAGNLPSVAKLFRARFPDARLIVAGDRNGSERSTSECSAANAATAVSGAVVFPDFGELMPGKGRTDFNDMARVRGPEAVAAVLRAVVDTAKNTSDVPAGLVARTAAEWPKLNPAALYGLAGELVAVATADSEADPAAVLLTALAWAAALFGRARILMIGDTAHHARLFIAIVGRSSRARKGTSTAPVRRIFDRAEDLMQEAKYAGAPFPCGLRLQVSPGPMSSGEGIIAAIRDDDPNDEDGDGGGTSDKRLLVIEGEFGAPLASSRRQGNTLSATLRRAWDGDTLAPMIKNSPQKATEPHVNIVAHITIEELKSLLPKSDIWNGFANRFVWALAERTRKIPIPTPMPGEEVDRLAKLVCERVRLAHDIDGDDSRVHLSPEAIQLWREKYDTISTDRPGAHGVVTARGEAQIMRLSMVYALLDGVTTIDVYHLKAAMAVWDYSDRSAGIVFGGLDSDHRANKILEALATGPKAQSDIVALFSGHVPKPQLDDILRRLAREGKVRSEQEKTPGRPITWWRLI